MGLSYIFYSRLGTWAALAAVLLTPAAAMAQYNVSTLLLEGTPIPGSTNLWQLNAGQVPGQPLSISGNYVAFVQCAGGSSCGPTYPTDGIWVENLSTKTFTHLVAPGAVAPETGGLTFTTFGGYALVAGGRVIFLGTAGGKSGYYSVPVTGSPISVIANQNTILPGLATTGTYSFGNSTSDLPQSDGTHVVFQAASTAGLSVYLADLNGQGLTELAGPNTPLEIAGSNCGSANTGFAQPRVSGSNVEFDSPSFFNNYLYLAGVTGVPLGPQCSPNGYIEFNPILQYNTPLPGEPSTVQFEYASLTAIDNLHVYFTGAGNGSNGVYQMNFDGSGLAAVLNSTESVPGITPPFSSVGGLGAAKGTVIFNVAAVENQTTSVGGLFAYQNNEIVRIAGTGDILAGLPGNSWLPSVGPNSISGGQVVFLFGNPGQIGVFLAGAATCAADVTSHVKMTQTPPRLNPSTGDYNSKVTIQNISGQTMAAPVSVVFDGLVNATVVGAPQPPELLNKGSGATTCLSPLGEAYLVVNGGAALAPGASTGVELNIADATGTPGFSTRVVSGTPR